MAIYCDTNQFPKLPFCGSYTKPHWASGLSNHYHLRFDPKLFHGICEIRCITCACVTCKSILDKLWICGILSKKQARYQPVTNCTHWPVLGLYNNWNIIELTPKAIPFEAFDEIHKVVLGGISENMAPFVKSGVYGAINTSDNTTNRFYVIQLNSEAYKIQNNTTIDGKVISAGELVVKSKYFSPCNKTLIGIGKNNHCNRLPQFQYAKYFIHVLMLS